MLTLQDRDTIDTYDAYFEVYDAETIDFWSSFPKTILDHFTQALPGKNVLSLGSGPGRDALLLRDRGLDVTCADASANMVRMTKELGFNSVLCDMRELPFSDNAFDGIWAYSSLIHVSVNEARPIVQKIHEILKPRGILLVGVIQGTGSEFRKIGDSEYHRYFEYYNDQKMAALTQNTGFSMTRLEDYQPKNHVYLNYILRKE